MRATLGMAAATVLWLACGGGENNPGGGGGGGNGTLTASINGQGFTADQFAGGSATSSSAVSVYAITGSHITSGTNAQVILLLLYNISGPGTYPLGVNVSNVGGTASWTDGSATWQTPLSGAAGQVIITSLTSGHMAGTFSFTAIDPTNPASTRTVTNGAFDVAVTGTPGTVQPYQGSAEKATLGTAAWNAGTIVVGAKSSGVYGFIGQSTTNGTAAGTSSVNITLTGVTGPATYTLSPGQSSMQVTVGSSVYSSSLAGSSGSVVVTSLSTARLKGTFSATLAAGGGATLGVSGGTFDIGLGP